MCKYCNLGKLFIREGAHLYTRDGDWYIDQYDGEFSLNADLKSDRDEISQCISISYCPFCGKRLTPYKLRNITSLSPEEQKEVFEEYCRMKYGQIENTEFNEGADIDLTEEDIKKGEHPLLGKFPEWLPGLLKDVGKKARNVQGEFIGIFEGITASFEDYYYRIRREDGSVVYESCVGNIYLF
jgi:hypothetical protein